LAPDLDEPVSKPAPRTLDELARSGSLPPAMGNFAGALYLQVFAAGDVYERLKTKAERFEYVGTEAVGKIECHKLKVHVEPSMPAILLWIDKGNSPWPRKVMIEATAARRGAVGGVELEAGPSPEISETYGGWKVEDQPSKELFTLEGARALIRKMKDSP
jgi:hypothetical protein